MLRVLLGIACSALLGAGLASAEPAPGVGAEPGSAAQRKATPDVGAAPPIPARLRTPELSAPDLPLLKLGLAVAAVGALGWAASAWSRRRGNARHDQSSRIEILARRGLGPRQQLTLVAVAGRRLLVGVGGDQIRLIADLSDAESFEATLERALPRSSSPDAVAPAAPPMAHSVPELMGSIGSFEGLDG
ncbi:MAG: FliO/MopB family protein [Myxococcota bacterium]